MSIFKLLNKEIKNLDILEKETLKKKKLFIKEK
jgi:hypothetical protein